MINEKVFILGELMIVPFIIFATIATVADTHTIVVDCYDEHNNEMIDIDCYEDEFDNEWLNRYEWLIAVFGLLMICGVLTILFGALY